MNNIKEQYMNLVCKENTDFLDEHLELPELKRLDEIGQLCGCDHTRLHNKSIADRLTILDHSYIAARMAYHFTGDKRQAILDLFHDVFKPVFAHATDYTFNDPTRQEKAETLGRKYVKFSNKTIDILKKYDISIEDLYDLRQYTILKNKKPKLCIDRLEGVLHTNLIWKPNMSINDIATIYNDLTVLINENKEPEIGFQTIEVAELFGQAVYHYSMSLKSNTDIFVLNFIGDIFKVLIRDNHINKSDLWELSEEDIIKIITNSRLKDYWMKFVNATKVTSTRRGKNELLYIVESIGKKRTVDPLCLYNEKTFRLEELSNQFKNLMTNYRQTQEPKYCYVKGIDRFIK